MNSHQFLLMALEPLASGDWKGQLSDLLAKLDIPHVESRGGLLVTADLRVQKKIEYSDGPLIQRIWLGSGRFGLSVTSQRGYFVTGSTQIDSRPEHIILNGASRPRSPDPRTLIDSQRRLIAQLYKGMNGHSSMVELLEVSTSTDNPRFVEVGDSKFDVPPNTLNDIYTKIGFDFVPDNFGITLCGMDGCSIAQIDTFRTVLLKTARQRQVTVNVTTIGIASVKARLETLGSAKVQPTLGRCVLFVLPDKKLPISPEAAHTFKVAETVGAPFRRAYANDPLNFSIPDQFPSLIMAAGGTPHRSSSAGRLNGIWTLGVDLSHRAEARETVLAITLVDPAGRLKGAWKISQSLDETVNEQNLISLLEHCRSRLLELSFTGQILVLRDGRLFENERYETYSDVLNCEVSVVEIRKRHNPQVVDGENRSIRAPWAGIVTKTNTMFISTTPPASANALANVLKVTWHPTRNRLNLEPSEIAEILISSSAAPGLGQRPHHLPSAIYWADGIAGASDKDLRFRGIPIN